MKIMQVVCGPGAGGAEVFVKDIALAMVKEGHDVHFVFLQTACESGRSEHYGENYLEELRKVGISYSFIGVRARKNPIYGWLRLRKIIKSFRPEIVHAHLYQVLVLLMPILGVPVVFTKHSINLGAPAWFVRFLLLRVSVFIAICSKCKLAFEPVAGKKVVQIDNGVDPSRLVRQEPTSNFPVQLTYVGRLSKEKNINLIFEACARSKLRDFKLNIVGEGPERSYLCSLSRDLGLSDRVIFLGNVDNPSRILAHSDIFLMSSISEGLPISLIEASISGLPCLVTDVGGCSEVLNLCNNGFYVPNNDLDSYSRKLELLIMRPDLRAQFRQNALNRSAHYHIERVVSDHVNVYRALL